MLPVPIRLASSWKMQTLETGGLPLCMYAPKHKETSEINPRYVSPSYGVCFFPNSSISGLPLLQMWKLQCLGVEISIRRDTNLVLDNEEDRELWRWHTEILGEIRMKKYLRQTSRGMYLFHSIEGDVGRRRCFLI